MEFTWLAVGASLAMGLAAVCVFVFAVKRDYFRNLEDSKYHVFWSDLEELVDSPKPSSPELRAAAHPGPAAGGPRPLEGPNQGPCRWNGERDHAEPGEKS